MSISFQPAQTTQPQPPATGPDKNAPGQKPRNPADVLKQKQKERLQQKQTEIQKQIKMLHMAGKIAGKFVHALPVQDDPNKDPLYLFSQVRPLLDKLRMANVCINNETQLVTGQTRKNESLYCVYIRRQAKIIPDIINRIKMNLDQFEYIVWNEKAIEIYLWWTYVPPVQQQAPRTGPVAPGAPAPAKG